MIITKKEKPAKRELKLFSVEVTLTPDSKDTMQMEATPDNALKKSRWKRRQRVNNAKVYAQLPEYHRIK